MNEPKRMTFQSQSDTTQTEELIESLLSNRYVLRMMQENSIDESVIRRYPWRIKKWLEDFSCCINCKGLKECRQAIRGYYNNATYDGILQIEKKACLFERRKLQEEKHLSMYLINDLPEDYRTICFESLNLEKEDPAYNKTASIAMQYCREGKGLYLCGPMGTGKTYLSACAANYMAKHDNKVCFIHYPSFTRRMAALVKTGEYQKEIERLGYCDFLVIDDIGGESVTPFNRDQILLPVLSKRYDSHLTTWFTSNEDFKTLKEHFCVTGKGGEETMKAERILERIENLSEMKTLFGEDRRKNNI